MVMHIRLSLAIMHVPDDASRRAMLIQIEKALGGKQAIEREVERYTIVRDTQRKGIWYTAQQAWKAYEKTATHHLLLQDDMLPCRDFLPGLKKVIEQRPEECITLFSMRKTIVEKVLANHGHWYVCPNNVWGGAVVLPVPLISQFLRWCQQHIPLNFPHDDSRLSLFLMQHQKKVWTTVPSLVEHLGAARSLVGHNNSRRIAATFLGNQSALSIDWSQGVENPIYAPGSQPTALGVYKP